MGEDLLEEFIAENDLILEFARQGFLIGVPGIPDPGFAHEAESCLMYDHRFLTLGVSAEENRCSENALKRRHQTPVLRSALLHPEGVQHFSRAAKTNRSALLPNGERSQKDWDEAILTPWQSVRGVPGHLKQKMSVSPFVQELSRRCRFMTAVAELAE